MMDASRFLIIGANGQLGRALKQRFPTARAVSRDTLDIADIESINQFDWKDVDVILNAAAYTNVDGAETSEGRIAAWNFNAVGVANLVQKAITNNMTLVHMSSEYVFDGTKALHTEDEPFAPLGVYAQTKTAGDIAASIAPKHYVVRTSWVIGDGKNFVRTMISLAEKGVSPTVVSDQVGRLTFTEQLVDGIEHLLKNQAIFGTYNLTNDGDPASWSDITRSIFKELGRNDLTVTNTTTAEYFKSKPESSPRPLQSTLELGKIKATGLVLRDWRDDLRAYIKHEQTKQL